ncbi:hypothetical protein WJX75_003532 [Coccomyxa subellipsoidea]|uniref:Acetyl-CoA synthetase-like protein n=1 Tax=Coccomyxa subellipsoidea TaxID=248742 RepID=A0ABR2YPC8_9CHLO
MAHVCHFLTALASRNPSRILTVCQGKKKTAREVLSRIVSLSRALLDKYGLRKGDRVALVARNTDLFFEVFMAVLAADAAMGKDMPSDIASRCSHIEELIQQRDGARGLDVRIGADGAAMICFTSGTSGAPKGAVLSHAALHAQALAKLLVVGYRGEDVYLHCAPLYHIGGMSSMLAVLAAGATQVFQPVFSAASTLDLIAAHSVTAFIARRLHLLFPYAHCTTAYGMTEACSSITFRPMQPEADPFHSRSCAPVTSRGPASRPETRPASAEGVCVGDPPPGIEVAVLCSTSAAESSEMGTEEAAQSLPRVSAVLGAVGEVVTRGPHVMLGYWGDPGASTGAILPGGWLRTGDLGRLDAGGALWLLGRLKDVVRSGSENVNAAAVERVLLQVPGVAGAAVVGLPHDRLGEQVSALLVLHADVDWSGRDLRSSANFGDDIRI